jgi:hypothetical protein
VHRVSGIIRNFARIIQIVTAMAKYLNESRPDFQEDNNLETTQGSELQ